ncbi:MAG: hypothetical protein ACFB21_11820 [Opitutales bacterium]
MLAVYLAIGSASAVLLIVREPQAVATLLSLQILYKLLTPLTVGAPTHPVVLINFGIAAFQLLTVAMILRSLKV